MLVESVRRNNSIASDDHGLNLIHNGSEEYIQQHCVVPSVYIIYGGEGGGGGFCYHTVFTELNNNIIVVLYVLDSFAAPYIDQTIIALFRIHAILMCGRVVQ